MKAVDIKVEYLKEPLGIDILRPRFDWNCQGGIRQSAYAILCTDNGEVLWDSGKVISERMSHIVYEGKELKSRQRVDVKISLWDENDRQGEETSTFFEMGLLKPEDFSAKWIAGDYETKKRDVRYPVDCFRKTFVSEQKVSKARLYITACGIYHAYLNDQRVSDEYFMPGTTDYDKRLQYQTYDVTDLIQKKNMLKVFLGDGWYRGSLGAYGAYNVFGRQTKLLLQLEIEYEDGQKQTIVSDKSFDWSNDGPVRFGDLKDGEVYVASMIPSYSFKAIEVHEEKKLCASNNVAIKRKEVFAGKKMENGVYDFSQNLSGILCFRIKGQKAQKIRVILGERLKDGNVDQSNFQLQKPLGQLNSLQKILLPTGLWKPKNDNYTLTPKQEVIFYCSGDEDVYEMNYAIAGFRYAQFFDLQDAQLSDVRSIALYSDMEETGSFESSSRDLDRLFENVRWSMKSNFFDLPIDCPTRERLGWTGDAQIFFETASYLMDVRSLYRKYLNDMKDNQKKSGKIASVVPRSGNDYMYDNTGESVGWADAAVLIPYRFYKIYNDHRILEENYDMMRRLGMFMIAKAGFKKKKDNKKTEYHKYVYEKGVHLGEWLEPEEFNETTGLGNIPTRTEEATAYMHYTMERLSEIAALLGKKEDSALFREYADGAKKAYNDLFLKQIPDTDRQAKLVRPLALGLADGETKKGLIERLAKAVVNKDYCIMTGFLSTPFILDTLTKTNHPDLAYKMLENKKSPSWLYEVENGATTIWENWEGNASLNHYSPGAVVSWFFNTIAGIRIKGENHFEIRPLPGGSLTKVSAGYRSPYGKVSVKWEISDDRISYVLTIPPNTTADVSFNGKNETLECGTYTFEEEW